MAVAGEVISEECAMRMLLLKIVRLLDGTPAVYGKRQSGQSVVELALITPILIILLAGLIEIGWFANNYLTLLDVTRAGARRGAVLQDQKSPCSGTIATATCRIRCSLTPTTGCRMI